MLATSPAPTVPVPSPRAGAPAVARWGILLGLVIALGVAARCTHLTHPLLGHHCYRQYETAAIARNFAEGDMNLLLPQIDWGGETPGYVESEFPAYSYLVACLYRLFGPHESLARGVNVALYALSALLLFRLTRKV